MESMSRKERLLAAYANKAPDRVPATPDISNMVPSRLTGKPFWDIYYRQDPPLWQAYIDAIKYFGIDGRFIYGNPQIRTDDQTTKTEQVLEKRSDRWLVRTVVHTPAGDLSRVTCYMRGDPPTDTEKLIKRFKADFGKLRYLFPRVLGFDPSLMQAQMTALGDLGILITNIAAPGLHTFAGLFEGNLEAATYAYYDEPDLFAELVDLADRAAVARATCAIEAGTEVIQTGGSGSITMSSPDLWRTMSLPTIKTITRLCREAGILSCVHSCGKEKALIDACYHETDLDSVNPLEQPPMGDCNLAEIKQQYGDRLSLQGNLHTTRTMLLGSASDVRLAALEAIRAAGGSGGFVLSTGDQCGRDTPDANIFAMVDVVREFGHYPLDLASIDAEIIRLRSQHFSGQFAKPLPTYASAATVSGTEPDQVEQGLPQVAARLATHGVSIMSVAGSLEEPFFAGCQAAGVPLIRVMANFKGEMGYFDAEAAMRAQLEAAVPLSEKYNVTIGVQQHYGNGVFNSMELRHLLDGFDRNRVGAIWDAAHSGLAGEDAAKGLGIVWDYLCLINLKAAYYKRVNGPEAEQARFKPYFTTARHGNTDWDKALAFCHAHGYQGPVCFPAEYTDEANVLTYIAQDLAYAKSLMQQDA